MTETKRDANASLASEPIGRLLLKFSVPCVLSMLVSALYNIVDQIFIGQSVGYLGNAATNVVYPFTVASWPWLFSRRWERGQIKPHPGQRRSETSHKCIGNGILATVFIGIVMTAAGFSVFRPDSPPVWRNGGQLSLRQGIYGGHSDRNPLLYFRLRHECGDPGRRLPAYSMFSTVIGRAEPDSGPCRHLRIPHGGTGRGHRHSHRPGSFLLRHHPVFPETEILSLLEASFLPDGRLLRQIGQLGSPALSHRSLLSSL